MTAPTRTPRHLWIEKGLEALGSGGPDAVRVDVLAKAMGVTRGGFYWHFENRQALLEEMLDTWERVAIEDVIDRVDAGGGDGRARLRRLFGLAGAGDEVLAVDLAVRDWSRRDPKVAERLRAVDNRRMEFMRPLFAEICPDDADVEARCLLTASLWIGSHFVAADHGGRTRAEVLHVAARRLLS